MHHYTDQAAQPVAQESARRAFFHQRLPIYRIAMHFLAQNISDLNEMGGKFQESMRRQAMDWFVNDDQGLVSLNEVCDLVSQFHRAALVLPGTSEELLETPVLSAECGTRIVLAELMEPEAIKSALHYSAGIWDEAGDGSVLCNSAPARKARAASAEGLSQASYLVSGIITEHLEQNREQSLQRQHRIRHNPPEM